MAARRTSRRRIPGRRPRRRSRRSGRPVTPRTSSAARCATRCSAARRTTGTSRPPPAPEQIAELFPGAVYENRSGRSRSAGRPGVGASQITTFRSDHDYADFRRPHRVEFGDAIELDLARRDFTVNAIAWGGRARRRAARLVDPHDGRADLRPASLRAVGDPRTALRARTRCGWSAPSGSPRRSASTIEPATLAAIQDQRRAGPAPLRRADRGRAATGCSRRRPPVGRAAAAGRHRACSATSRPELAAQRGSPQNKVPGEDLWDHTLRAVDARGREPPDRAPRRAAPRHRQAGDDRRRPVRRPRHGRGGAGRRRCSTGSHWPRPSATASSTCPAPHVRLRADAGPTPRSGGSSRKVGRDALDDLFAAARGGQRRLRPAARCGPSRRVPRRGSRTSSRRARRSTCAVWRSTATT